MNWIQVEAAKADASKDIAILENPEARRLLDDRLVNRLAPMIWKYLRATGYRVAPENPEPTSELAHALVRQVPFILFDYLSYPFLQGTFSSSADGWMFDRTFNLGLPRDTDPDFVFRILGDSRFAGMPPTLDLQESPTRPDWGIYYNITFRAGSGTSWGSGIIDDHALKTVENVIVASQGLYNIAMADKFSSMDDVKRFLNLAASAFGAS